MSKLSALADRIKQTKEFLSQHADDLSRRLDEVEKVAPKVFDGAHAFLDQQEADVQSLEDGLRQLSNLPLVPSGDGS